MNRFHPNPKVRATAPSGFGEELRRRYSENTYVAGVAKAAGLAYWYRSLGKKQENCTIKKQCLDTYPVSERNYKKKSIPSWNLIDISCLGGHIFDILGQNIIAKYLLDKRDKDTLTSPCCGEKYRLCKISDPHHQQLPTMSSKYYLPVMHDIIAKTICNVVCRKDCPDEYTKGVSKPSYILTIKNMVTISRILLPKH